MLFLDEPTEFRRDAVESLPFEDTVSAPSDHRGAIRIRVWHVRGTYVARGPNQRHRWSDYRALTCDYVGGR